MKNALALPLFLSILLSTACPAADGPSFVGSVSDVCRELANAQCTRRDRCDALGGSFDDCVTSNAYECCTSFDDCGVEAYAEPTTLEACTASIRSESCSGGDLSRSCTNLINGLLFPPIDTSVIDQAFCDAAAEREQETCGEATNLCESFIEIDPHLTECDSVLRAVADCYASPDCSEPGLRCYDEAIAVFDCREEACGCDDDGCADNGPGCPEARRHVFVTEPVTLADFGGTTTGADALCAAQASAANLTGSWRAFYASEKEPLNGRIGPRSYFRLDNTLGLRVRELDDRSLEMRVVENVLYGADGEAVTPARHYLGELIGWRGAPADCEGWTSEEGLTDLLNLGEASTDLPMELCSHTPFLEAHILCLEQ